MKVFQETQRFNQWWLQLLNIGLFGLVLFGLYKWFIAKESMGNVAPSDLTGQLLVIGSVIPILILFFYMRMETTIDEIGIHYRFIPFHSSKKTVRWADMKDCHVRKYRPIREYGGWGLRGSFSKNKAYNVKGNIGIQMVLDGSEKILIGTQKEEDTKKIIERYFKTNHE